MILGSGGQTDDRRRLEFEIAAYYSIKYTPRDEFGCLFFKDWNEEEWLKFDSLMIGVVRFYMENGVIPPTPINLIENKLKQATHPDFILFMDENVVPDIRYDKSKLIEEFKKDCPSQKFLSANMFKKWIDKWAETRGYKPDHYKSNGQAMVFFCKSPSSQ